MRVTEVVSSCNGGWNGLKTVNFRDSADDVSICSKARQPVR